MVYKILLVAFCFCIAFVKIWFDVYLVSMFIDHIIDVISSKREQSKEERNEEKNDLRRSKKSNR